MAAAKAGKFGPKAQAQANLATGMLAAGRKTAAKNRKAQVMHPSTAEILRYFEFSHLSPDLQQVSAPFHALAHEMAGQARGP